MTFNEDYIKELEDIIGKFLKPVEGIPFHIAVKALYGHKIIPLDLENNDDMILINDLCEVARIAGKKAKEKGIFRNRPNEVGNDIEIFVKKAMFSIGFSPKTPMTNKRCRKAVDYPDIYFKDRKGRHVYLECKTYNKANIDTTQRAFYFSLAENKESKIIYDAPHLVISFEIAQITRNNKRYFIPAAWKIVSIHSMQVSVKHEFNASNKDIYREDAILAEGEIS